MYDKNPKAQKHLSKFQAQLNTCITQASYLSKTFRLLRGASASLTSIWLILIVTQGILPGATIYLSKILVNSLVEVVGTGLTAANIRTLTVPVLLMTGILALAQLLSSVSDWIRAAQAEYVDEHITSLIQSQSVTIDFSCYESSEYNDRLSRARDGASNRSLDLLESSGILLQNGVTSIAMGALLIPYGVWLPIIVIVSFIPAFYVTLRLNKIRYRWSQQTTLDRRRLKYYDLLMSSGAIAAEIRLFNLGWYFQQAYQRLRSRLRIEYLKLIRQQTLSRLGATSIAFLLSCGVLIWMGNKVLLGQINLGDLALFYQAFNKSQNIVKAIVNNISSIDRHSLFLGNLFEFLELKPQIVDPAQPMPVPCPLTEAIKFNQLSFRYPGSNEDVLHNFNLTIPAGQVVAIVGDNGAGKSTLIKLLCRFYEPQSGAITIDGQDLRCYSIQELRQSISVLFQFPTAFYLSAADNIALGDVSSPKQRSQIETAAKGSGIDRKLRELPQGYDTMLGKYFPHGTELSGGEWQRLALARAFLKQAQIMVLDEPTSAMDPWTEFDWLERFRDLTQEQTVIMITHRFTLARRADLIYVMRQGKVVESGNHHQLMALNQYYADSWHKQMGNNPSCSYETE